MGLKVAYMPDEVIERDAEALLDEYAHARHLSIKLPIPVDDIVEKHLKLGIEFNDLHRLFGVPRSGMGLDPDIVGAIYFDQKRIVIDESLDPDANPTKEGRYRYTLAHEAGHWRLHRDLVGIDPAQGSLFDTSGPPSVICRKSDAKERVEIQADLYASSLLMPRRMVHFEWQERLGRSSPLLLCNLRPNGSVMMRAERRVYDLGQREVDAVDDALLEEIAEPFAKRFRVSRIAMRIRLERMGLMLRKEPAQKILGLL
jgi:Zn-dependent peptidase ImmA (M78 family)